MGIQSNARIVRAPRCLPATGGRIDSADASIYGVDQKRPITLEDAYQGGAWNGDYQRNSLCGRKQRILHMR